MKLIHCADIHLGAKISGFPKELSDRKKEDVRASFSKMVDYARENDVRAILIAGDLFDSDKPFKKDKDFFFGVVRGNPNIDFLYLRGNHDLAEETDPPENLKGFSSEWTAYEYGNVVVSGVESTKDNASSVYSSLSLNENKKNVVLLHGQIGDGTGADIVNLARLRNKHIDYLALGHVHTFKEGKLDDRGRYAYSGCLEGRGFDETGEKGFVLLSVDQAVSAKFIPFSQSVLEEKRVDVSGVKDAYSAAKKVREAGLDKNRIYRVILTGELDATVGSLREDVQKLSESDCAFVRVKDETKKRIDVEAYVNDPSLKGEFIRTVYESDEYDEEEKAILLSYGLRALDGREADE